MRITESQDRRIEPNGPTSTERYRHPAFSTTLFISYLGTVGPRRRCTRLGNNRLAAPKFRNGILYPWVLNVGSLLSQKISGTSEKKVYHDPGSMTWQVQQGLSRFALPIAFFASSHLEPSTHPTAKHVARATHHLYLPILLGVTENINETVLHGRQESTHDHPHQLRPILP